MNPPASIQCDLEMTGTLLKDGEARSRIIDGEGLVLPVLCLEVESESLTRGHVHVEVQFPIDSMKQCEMAAARYKRGARVTFRAPSVGIVLLARNCSHVHLVGEQAAA